MKKKTKDNTLSKLTSEQMDKIVQDYGIFLELSHGPLMEVFLSNIPEVFLPYPKNAIEKSMMRVEEKIGRSGQLELAKQFAAARAVLLFYVETNDSIDNLLQMLKNPKFRKLIINGSGKRQRERLDGAIDEAK